MQITVFGASGKVGRQVVAEALSRGHTVQAFIHKNNPFKAQEGLTVLRGDLGDKKSISQALEGSSVVICTLGSWKANPKNVLTTGMQAIIPAMEQVGIQRIVTLTGSGARLPNEKFTFIEAIGRQFIILVAPAILRDGEEHMRLLHESGLGWTTIRASAMRNGARPSYILRNRPGSSINFITRSAVAASMLDVAESDDWIGKAPCVRQA